MKNYKWKKKCKICSAIILNRKKGAKYCIACSRMRETNNKKKRK